MYPACACTVCSGYGPIEKFSDLPEEITCSRCGGEILGDDFMAESDPYDGRPYFYHLRKDCEDYE